MKYATLFVLALLAAAPKAAAQSAPGGVCGVDYFGPCLPAPQYQASEFKVPALPRAQAAPAKTAAASPAAVPLFGTGVMDAFSMASQDPLTQRGLRQDARGTLLPETGAKPARMQAADYHDAPSRKTPTLRSPRTTPSKPGPAGAWFSDGGPAVLPGGPQDAQGVHDGNAASVYVPAADGRMLNVVKSPSLYTELGRMSETARRSSGEPSVDKAYDQTQALWERNPGFQADKEPVEASDGQSTREFGLGN